MDIFKAIINRIKRTHQYKRLWDYRSMIISYFDEIDVTYEEAESTLHKATSGKCLYFESETGQQLEALIFSAIALIKKDVDSILEIGTGGGANTVILAALFPSAIIHTYDIPVSDRDYDSLAWRADDSGFSERIFKDNIIFHEKNSFLMLSDNLPDFDLVYVDGGHSYPAVAWDAMYAYNKTRTGGFIVFHDYNRPPNDPTRDSNHVKDLLDNYLSKIIEEDVVCLPWAGYDRKARICLIHKR